MRWVPKKADAATVETFATELGALPSLGLKNPRLAATVARLLVMRGINGGEAAEHFLAPTLAHLHSPYLMAGMKPAVDRIEAAIANQESILIYGDYDVDGTTAIVILMKRTPGIPSASSPPRIPASTPPATPAIT